MKPLPFRLLSVCCLLLLLCAVFSCGRGEGVRGSRLSAFDTFLQQVSDSLTAHPQWVRALALRHMAEETDSLAWYSYAGIVMKTYFFTFDQDSVTAYFERGRQFLDRQRNSPQVEDLKADYHNSMGNLYARLGRLDTAVWFFERSYHYRLHGIHTENAADILMNLADVHIRQGQYDLGAYWYRRALLLCDSLDLPAKKTAVFYGLGQVYMALRDFEQCDLYFDLAGESYADMLPYEQFIYLNNRGNSYYYRDDYPQAMHYFRRCLELLDRHSDLMFERNLCYLNMSDVFLKMDRTDSAETYLKRCRPFFEGTGTQPALYYIDTQELELALKRNDLQRAAGILQKTAGTVQRDPDMLLIRNMALQRYYEMTGQYRQAYFCQQRVQHVVDSVRSERVRMRVADAALQYAQDSTLMAQNVLIQRQKNEVLMLRQNQMLWVALCAIAFLVVCFLHMYNKKKQALLLARNRQTVSSLRLENIRNRLSPHFIFNLLNREMANCRQDERQNLATLVKLMRRNLELAEQLCVSLTEELDFVQTYLDLERRSLGDDFRSGILIDPQVRPEGVFLPSMLIQIPVENAVKHALRDKEGERRLWIAVRREEGKKGISIRVTDNGGGYRPDTRNRGTGTGLKVIMQTIQILNMKNRENIEAAIHDTVTETGETGCEVSFFLPDKYDFRL